MSDVDSNMSLSDEENEMHDLEKLNAVLVDDAPCTSASVSQYSRATSYYNITKYEQSSKINAGLVDDAPCTSASVSQYSRATSYNNITKYEQSSKIDAALALNRKCDENLRRLQKVLLTRLTECREKLRVIRRLPHEKSDNKTEVFHYVSCGKPYFKDSSNFPAPDNEDTIFMSKTKMYDFSNIAPVSGWTAKDKSNFLNLLHKMSQEIRKKELNSSIAETKRSIRSSPTKKKELEKKIALIRTQIERVKKMSLNDLALPIDKDYDWIAIANKLNKRHNASEYRSLWRLFLHPSINKKPWSKAEHVSLQKISFGRNLQDWDTVARELDTGRTNYQCFVYFRTNMSNTFTGRKWTNEEVECLKKLIDYYRQDKYIPWGKVATAMQNRTKIQIYNKYLSLCQHRKGRFLPEEDTMILTCAENFGPDFQKMTQYLPGRTSGQCRVRFQVLAKRRISCVWTVNEDKHLIQLMANQASSTNYSSVTKYFPGKDRIQIRTRYLTLTQWMRKNPNIDISRAPRRGARLLGHGQGAADLNKAIEELRYRLHTEENDVKSREIAADSPHEMLDNAIIEYLATERVKMDEARELETFKALDERSLLENTKHKITLKSNLRDLRSILILFRAKLNKEKFRKSCTNIKYKDLLEADPDLFKPQVKTYSKRKTEKNMEHRGIPDIWGNDRLGPLEYVLPANYATITGCKKLMSYTSTKPKNDDVINVRVVSRKNLLLKEQVLLLMERFKALFLWPMLLSNAPPDPYITMSTEERVAHANESLQSTKNVFNQEDNYKVSIPFEPLLPKEQEPSGHK